MRRIPMVLALAAILLASCSADGGQPVGAGSEPASSAEASVDPIPPVQDPKRLAGTPPCSLLSPVQLTDNHMDLPARSKDVLGAPGCVWDNTAHTREIRIYVDIGNDVLHNVYAQRKTFPVFEVTQLAAHPAIRTKDNVAATSCTVRVATAERQTFVVVFTSLRQGLEEPCGPARALAEAVLANLPPLKG